MKTTTCTIAAFLLAVTCLLAYAHLCYDAPTEPDFCAMAERSAAESISFYQDPSEAKNHDEKTKCLAALCRQQNPDQKFKGIKRVALQNKAGAFVS